MLKYLKSEKGDVLVLFTFLFVIMVGFISLALDYGLALAERARMYEIANIMRDTRFTKNTQISNEIHNSTAPGKVYEELFVDYARKNGFKGKLTVIFNEHTTEWGRRVQSITMILEKEQPTTTLKLFGFDKIPIKVQIDGSSLKSNGNGIWNPTVDTGSSSWKKYRNTIYIN